MTALTTSTADSSDDPTAHSPAAKAPPPFRVLWVTENHPPSRGGMAQSSDRIVRGLREGGTSVDVVHLTRAPRPRRIERGQGGHDLTIPLEGDPEHALRRLWADITRLDRDAPVSGSLRADAQARYTHVVAFGGTLPLLAAPTYAAWLDVSLITLLRGNDFDTGMFSVRRRDLVVSALEASRVICTVASPNVALVQRIVPTGDVRWITNGIDLESWGTLPSERQRATAWRAANVDPQRLTLGIIGQLKAKKGVVFFLDALAASRFAPQAHVVLIGDADDELVDWLAKHDHTIAYSHLSFLDRYELLGLYPACDVVALPSFYDGLPNVALEAAALGIPVLSSDAGGLGDLVVDGETGFRFAAGDAGACRGAIDRALSASAAQRAALGAAARARVQSGFTAQAETAAYLEVLAASNDHARHGTEP